MPLHGLARLNFANPKNNPSSTWILEKPTFNFDERRNYEKHNFNPFLNLRPNSFNDSKTEVLKKRIKPGNRVLECETGEELSSGSKIENPVAESLLFLRTPTSFF
jgi:aspartyl-tRNA synthetase